MAIIDGGIDYEGFVKELVGNVQASGRKIAQVGSGAANRVAGASGYRHQVDLSFVDESFKVHRLVVIECKNWIGRRGVGVEQLRSFLGLITDIQAAHANYEVLGIFYYSNHLDDGGARQIADHYKILLENLRNDSGQYEFRYENYIEVVSTDRLTVGGAAVVS